MKYTVIIEQNAFDQIIDCVIFVKNVSTESATKLYEEIMESIRSLEEFPLRNPVDPDFKVANQEERKMIISNGRYFILYSVTDKEVFVEYFKDARKR